MRQLRFLVLVPAAVLALAGRAHADEFTIVETLSPNEYTVRAGSQVTLSGFFMVSSTLSGTLPFTYYREYLFGLQPSSPHLETATGALVWSMDFDPIVNGNNFLDMFADVGYLGPAALPASGIFPVTPLRTFRVPLDTAPGTYRYSYGVGFSPPPEPGLRLRQFFDTTLTLDVTPVPEPATLVLLGSGLIAAVIRGRRDLAAWRQLTSRRGAARSDP